MPLKTYTIPFTKFSKKSTFRADFKFSEYYELPQSFQSTSLKKFIFKISNGKDISKDNYVEWNRSEVIYPTVNNIKTSGLILDEVIGISEDFSGGYFIDDKDIVITRSGTVGITKCWNKEEINTMLGKEVEAIPSGYLIVIKLKIGEINPLFLEYYLNSKLMVQYFYVFGVGKTQKNIAQGDIKQIPFPKISCTTQNYIVAEIEPIEQNIAQLKSQILPASDIINRVFAREFGFDGAICHEFGKGMTASTQTLDERKLKVFETPLYDLARTGILRKSTRFHNPPTKKLMDFLKSIKTLEVQNVITEDIHRGASPNYDEDGTIPVIKTGHLKNGYIEISTEEFVSEESYKSSLRSQGKYGDILIASTGKGSLGKIDIIEHEEQEFVVDGHVSIIRIDTEKYNPLFFVYFFRSILGYFQFEKDYTGATNQIELYAKEIGQFRIPDISLSEQQRIVDEIKAELDAQESIGDDIATERAKIDMLIEKAIKG